MTGKVFKEWAARIPDDAEVQSKREYSNGWQPLDPTTIRANLVISPPIQEQEPNTLEGITD